MNCKIENSKRSTDTSVRMLKPPLKSIVKDRARKQLWESLLDVYENEASVGVDLDCEEVDVNQLEVWSVSHSENTFRALPHVARTNPQLLADALPGAEELQLGNQENLPRKRKTTRSTSAKINKKRKSSSTFKIYKSSTPVSIEKKRTIYKKTSLKDKSNFKLEPLAKISSKKSQEQTNTAVKNISDISKNPKVKKEKPVKGKKRIQNQNIDLEHNCNFKLKYFDNSSDVSSRPDGRTFYCKLIFKVCECDESDEVF